MRHFQRRNVILLAGHVASAPGLETDDDVGDLHVSLLLQVSQDSCSEEHFALANTVQVGIQLQASDLERCRENLKTPSST